MTNLMLELSTEQYEQLQTEATQAGEPVQRYAHRLLTAQLMPAAKPFSEREQVTAALRKAGLLVEISPEEKRRAENSTVTLEEVRAALDAVGGQPLSELIIEMRRPKA